MKKSLFCLLCQLLFPLSLWAWGGSQHVYINYFAGRAVPEDMAAFRAFAHPMAYPGIYPDLWRPQDWWAEGPRHYFEPDRLPDDVSMADVDSDMDAFLARTGLARNTIGTAPWTIMQLMSWMSDGMRTNDWIWVARCGAAMGHYVGDLHQPLHCTRNFNGQESGQPNVHGRYEMEMMSRYFQKQRMRSKPGIYLDDPFPEILKWVEQSYTLSAEVLEADRVASKAAAGDLTANAYYEKLWELTEKLTYAQLNASAQHLSSLWYTAWINAGKPPIPKAPETPIPSQSVFSGVEINWGTAEDEDMQASDDSSASPKTEMKKIP